MKGLYSVITVFTAFTFAVRTSDPKLLRLRGYVTAPERPLLRVQPALFAGLGYVSEVDPEGDADFSKSSGVKRSFSMTSAISFRMSEGM